MKDQLVLSNPLSVFMVDSYFVVSSDGAGREGQGRAGLGSIDETD